MALSGGARLGPYEIVALLGAGGMGEVYRARDSRIGRTAAVKILPPALAEDPGRLERFEKEARAVGSLNHPNVLALHDVGREAGQSYVVTELLEGQTLRDRLEGAPIPSRKAVEYAVQIAHGLAAAHDGGGHGHERLTRPVLALGHPGGCRSPRPRVCSGLRAAARGRPT